MKRALVLGAGFYYARSLQKIREGGFHVIAVDRDPHAPGAAQADEFYPVDITDHQGVLELARRTRPDCVIPLNEFGMQAHALVSAALGLPGVGPEQVAAVVDKQAMRQAWEKAGLRQPRFHACRSQEQVADAAGQIGFPCLIKPADSGGSGRGVIIINRPGETAEGFAFALPHARNGVVLVEEFIPGVELTVEGLCCRGRHAILAVSDKVKPPLRTRVATSLNYPAYFNGAAMAKAKGLVDAAVRALGLTDCATHTELIITPQGEPFLVEMGARGGGGHIFSTIVEAVSGVNMPVALANILSGQEPQWQATQARGACYRFFTPPAGTITAIEGVEQARNLHGVLDIGMFKKPGDQVRELVNSQERTGFVVTTGPDRESAWRLANEVERRVRIAIAA
jgi:biotin carboxylase